MKRQQLFTLIATIIGSGIVFLDGSIVNLALPKISSSLGASFADLQWIVDGYLLTLSALILLGGSLGDIYGRKKLFITGVSGFGLASVVCGVVSDTETLIAARMLQGLFGALLVPQSLAIITNCFEGVQRGKAIGTWTAWSGIATAIAPLIGGYLLDVTSWRWIFFLNIPLVAACIWFAWSNIEESRHHKKRSVDFFGAVIAMITLAGITYGLIEGPAQHWNSTAVAALIGGGIASLYFLWHESRQKDPMVHLRLFASRNFSGANAMTFAMYGALSGFVLSVSVYLQTTMHYSSIQAGLSTLPITVILLLISGRIGALAAKLGSRLFMTFGPLLTAAGILSMYMLDPGDAYLTAILPGILLFSFGLGLTVAPLTTTVMNAVDEDDAGIASAVNNAISRLGGLIIIALLGIFGATNAYRSGIVICAIAAILAGFTSFLTIRTKPLKQ